MSILTWPDDVEVAILLNIDGTGDIHRAAHEATRNEMIKRFGKNAFKQTKSSSKSGCWVDLSKEKSK